MPMMPIDVQTDGALACVNGDFTPLLNGANLSEAKFLLQQLLTYSIDRGVAARKVEADLKNCQQRLKEVEDAARIQEGLLTLVEQPDDDTATVIMESSTMSIDRPLSSDSAVQSQSVSSQDGTASVDSGSPKRGGFVSTSNAINVESKLVTRIFTIKAHGKSLLSTQLSNGMLLTGSKDRSARIFDLEKQCEVAQLEHHINAVTTARFVPDSNLVLTTSSYMAHIWDLRSSQCVTTLRSSGIVDHAEFNYAQPRVNLIPPSESRIAAACLDPSGCLLFTSFERDIRIWDLRRLSENVTARCVNATKTASSEITCLSTSMLSNQSVRLFSGSKDHAVKVFDVPFDIVSGRDFEPVGESLLSHDVISAVVPYRDSFFVASHDKSVAKYNVRDMERDHVSTSHALPVIALNLFRSPITNEDLLVSLDKKVMCFWDISGYKHQFLSKMSVNTEAMCLGTEPSPDYPVSLCTGHSNGDVELYRLKSE
uniref:WD_REPEATS_REGION domain-containing protein n=1 Tax=Steinernema glaseri TaxID=37863 RepID=A0A1I8A832_9BILA